MVHVCSSVSKLAFWSIILSEQSTFLLSSSSHFHHAQPQPLRRAQPTSYSPRLGSFQDPSPCLSSIYFITHWTNIYYMLTVSQMMIHVLATWQWRKHEKLSLVTHYHRVDGHSKETNHMYSIPDRGRKFVVWSKTKPEKQGGGRT